MSDYSYTPLSHSHIRLLRLEPHAHALGSPIRCQLVCVELSSAHYEALSYCWGDISEKKDILIGEKVMAVGENLWSALDHLRGCDCTTCGLERGGGGASTDHLSSRYLWVDALCINQNDVQERNHEVARMGDIYRKAQRVLAWLGPGGRATDLAMNILNSIGDMRGTPNGFLWRLSDRKALQSFVQHPYFSRMWIVQEVILAREVIIHCGKITLPWSKLSMFLDDLQEVVPRFSRVTSDMQRQLKSSLAMNFHQSRKKWQERQTTLDELLYSYAGNVCQDPRDKIYSLLAIAADCQNGELEADYAKSLGALYQDVIRFWTMRDYRGKDCSRMVVYLSQLFQYSVQPKLEMKLEIPNNLPLIPVVGWRSGKISRLGPTVGENELLKTISSGSYVQVESLGTKHILNELRISSKTPPRPESDGSFATISGHQRLYTIPTVKSSLSRESRRWRTKAARWFASSVAIAPSAARTFHFFELSTGIVGISPKYVQYDDIICTFICSPVAILLRRLSKSKRYGVVARVVIVERPSYWNPRLGYDSADWLKLIRDGFLYLGNDWLAGGDPAEVNLSLGIETLKWCTSNSSSLEDINPYGYL
jgi:hypothetical protein